MQVENARRTRLLALGVALSIATASAGLTFAFTEAGPGHPAHAMSAHSSLSLAKSASQIIEVDATISVPNTSTTTDPSDSVDVIDPSLIDPGVNEVRAQEVIDAQVAAASTLSPADFKKAQSALSEMLAAAPPSQVSESTPVSNASAPGVVLASQHTVRVTIYQWQLDAVAWYYIVTGGVITALGGLIDCTGVGIPVGAILNAVGIGVGIGGAYLLWWADKYYPDHKTYTIRW